MKTSLNLFSMAIFSLIILILLISFKPQEPQTVSYQFKQFTSIESVIKAGLGRSRIIISSPDGQDIGKDLLNIYSVSGINFKNVASNDVLIVQTIDSFVKEGWELYSVTTGVQSPSGNDGQGIYMTRYLFRKPM